MSEILPVVFNSYDMTHYEAEVDVKCGASVGQHVQTLLVHYNGSHRAERHVVSVVFPANNQRAGCLSETNLTFGQSSIFHR